MRKRLVGAGGFAVGLPVGGGWWRLVGAGGFAVGLPVGGGWWRLVAVGGGWWRFGGWRLVVPGGVLPKNKFKSGLLRTALGPMLVP